MGLEVDPDRGLHKEDMDKLIEGKIATGYIVSYSINVSGQFNDLIQKLNPHM